MAAGAKGEAAFADDPLFVAVGAKGEVGNRPVAVLTDELLA